MPGSRPLLFRAKLQSQDRALRRAMKASRSSSLPLLWRAKLQTRHAEGSSFEDRQDCPLQKPRRKRFERSWRICSAKTALNQIRQITTVKRRSRQQLLNDDKSTYPYKWALQRVRCRLCAEIVQQPLFSHCHLTESKKRDRRTSGYGRLFEPTHGLLFIRREGLASGRWRRRAGREVCWPRRRTQ
jgi:hypothetical protein